MTEQEYWMNRVNQDTVNGNLIFEAQMNYWAAKKDYIIVEALKPKIMPDGDKWVCLYGSDLQEGVAGFGDTPNEAILDFNQAFYKK
jgi:hypothetical protein